VKAHVEIKVRLKQLPPGGLHEVLLNFTDETEGWKFPRATSEDYQCHNGRDAGYAIFMQDGSEVAAVALANLAAHHYCEAIPAYEVHINAMNSRFT
jgi:hypothetical protein